MNARLRTLADRTADLVAWLIMLHREILQDVIVRNRRSHHDLGKDLFAGRRTGLAPDSHLFDRANDARSKHRIGCHRR
jgi:hypothetical protein